MKTTSRWFSQRMHKDALLARWGTFGTPVLLYPTAGGDAEEMERFLMMKVLAPLIDAGKIKVYSCDSVAGKAMVERQGSPQYRQWILNQFHQYVRHEVVPAIRTDCQAPNIEIVAVGASIGAFHAVSSVCRFPDVFSMAIGMSGTYDIRRFMSAEQFGDDFWVSSAIHFVPTLSGPHLDKLRQRFVLLPSGEGKAEDISESWNLARVLGAKGIPNRVDSWGKETPHDWVTWRAMLPKYLAEFVAKS